MFQWDIYRLLTSAFLVLDQQVVDFSIFTATRLSWSIWLLVTQEKAAEIQVEALYGERVFIRSLCV